MKKNCFNVRIIGALGIIISSLFGCVESLTENQQAANPTIEITKPVTGDTVEVGSNPVTYDAADGTGGAGLSFYEVYINNKFVQRYEQNSDGTNPTINLEIDSTLLGAKISYFIKVYNASSKSKESDVQKNIYVRDRVPNKPENLILTKLNDFSVNLLWDDYSKNEKGFELWRKDGGGGVYRKLKTLPPNTISTDDTGLSAFTDYFYMVRSYNDSGPSDFSNEVSTSNVSGGPWNLQAEAIGSSIIHLTWTDFAVNELGFIIERTDPFTTEFSRIAIVPRGSTEYDDNTVSPSTGYRYRVAYYTSSSVSGYSNEVSISTYYTDVQAPSNLTAAYDQFGNVVILNWTDNSVVEKETIIERKTGSSGSYSEYARVAQDEVEIVDSGVQRGQTYHYRVRQSLGSKAYTPYSNEVKIIIPN